MKIEITEEIIKLNVDDRLQTYTKGDTVTVSDEVGQLCCEHGWAKDVDGNVSTGERVAGVNVRIQPDAVSQDVK